MTQSAPPLLIDGNAASEAVLSELREAIADRTGPPPGIVVVRVGEDPASRLYTNKKVRVAESIGMRSRLLVLPEGITREALQAEVRALNEDPEVHGILVQSPIPGVPDEQSIFNQVAPEKDVDGLSSVNLGKLCQEDPSGFVPCTPGGVMELVRRYGVQTVGRHVVVVGRSVLVGKPAALLFLRKAAWADATVTVCHSRTPDLAAFTRQADILITAIGRPLLISREMVKPGAVVIDVGISQVPDPSRKSGYRVVGDVDFGQVAPISSAITPVPGGVGPMTVAMLMRNTYLAWVASRDRASRT